MGSKPSVLPEETKSKILELFDNRDGLSRSEISRETGVSLYHVTRVLKEKGFVFPRECQRLTQEKKTELIEILRLGEFSKRQISNEYGVSLMTLYRLIRKEKIDAPRTYNVKTPDPVILRMKELREQGLALRAISERLKVSLPTVYRYTKKDSPRRLAQDTIEEITKLRDSGLLKKDIAKKLGVAPSTVTYYTRQYANRKTPPEDHRQND